LRADYPSHPIIESDRIQCFDLAMSWPEKAQIQGTTVGTLEANTAAEKRIARAPNRDRPSSVQPLREILQRDALRETAHFGVECSRGKLAPRLPS
jgi:hypothetical protein